MTVSVISELSDQQRTELHDLFQNEWWTEGREPDEIQKMLNESDVIIGMADTTTNELIGFARVLTDTVYKALIFDVIVRSDHRGTGLGERLIEQVIEHPALSQVAHFELYCLEELVPFYERWGFTAEPGNLLLMRRG